MEKIQIINLVVDIILAVITFCSLYYAKRTIEISIKQLKLVSNPVIGIAVNEISITKVFAEDRRQMNIDLEITNIGNDPAIDILIDGEVELQYSDINGEKSIPSRFEPLQKSFLMSGEKSNEEDVSLNFGNKFLTHFFDDARENTRLNLHRIETNPWKKPFLSSKLNIFVYYSNNIGQYFKSQYNIYICLMGEIPKENETAKVNKVYIPRPIFSNKMILEKDMIKELSERSDKRDLCGY